MSSTRNQEIIRSLGEHDGFILYMFEEDVKMIEQWATADPYLPYKRRPNGGYLLGLWTNTLNPVVHIVFKDHVAAEEYAFIKSSQFEAEKASLMLSRIGCWTFENQREMQRSQARFVFLEVEVKPASRHINFHPFLLTEQGDISGKIEVLKGENPYRLSNKLTNSATEEEDARDERHVTSIMNRFESGATKVKKRIPEFMDKLGTTLNSAMHVSTVEHKAPKVPPSASDYSESEAKSTSLPSQYERKDVSTCTKANQWYLTEHGQETLKEISNKLEEVINEKPKISRDNDTHNIMILFSFENKNYVILFPPNFPTLPAELYHQHQSRGSPSLASSYYNLMEKKPSKLVEEIINKLH